MHGARCELVVERHAQAGVAFFLETCVAAAKDFSSLEKRLPALGMKETNDIPSRALGNPKSTRTWTSNAFPGQPGDGFVQHVIGTQAEPFEVCTHVSRPGEPATEALDCSEPAVRAKAFPLRIQDRSALLPVKDRSALSRLITIRVGEELGSQMLNVAVGWQVYDATRDPLSLAYIGLAQFLPTIGMALIAGQAADRF